MSNDLGPLYAISYYLMDRCVEASDLIFDLGANTGGMSETFASKGATVHAYEPVPEMFEQLNRKSSGLIRPYNLAVGEHAGRMENVNVFNTWSLLPDSTQRAKALEFAGKPPFSCYVTTVDQQAELLGLPDFIKIDVDGYEFRVLRGAERTLKERKPWMMFEYSYLPQFFGDSIPAMVEYLYDLGYQAWSMNGNYCAPTAQDMLNCFPAHTSYDIMLAHKDNPIP